jgi:hypothetical protein
MKTFPAFLVLLAFANSSFAQSGPTATAAAAGCGAETTKFDVQSTNTQHPFAKPGPGKALVYFLQDDTYFESRPRPTTRFGIDGAWVGATQSNAYFYFAVDPGEHHLSARVGNPLSASPPVRNPLPRISPPNPAAPLFSSLAIAGTRSLARQA